MSTKIKIFHSGDFKGPSGLEEKVNSFCKGLEIQKISTGVRSGITLATGSQLVGMTYDIIVVYSENSDESQADPIKRGKRLEQLYLAIRTSASGDRREDAYKRYVKFIEEVVAELQGNINATEVARLFGGSAATIKARDKRIAKLVGREVCSVRTAAENLGRSMSR